MNRADRYMVTRDPVISLTALRFFKHPGVTPPQILAGFRGGPRGAHINFRTWYSRPPAIVRMVRASRRYTVSVDFDVRSNIIRFCVETDAFIYEERTRPYHSKTTQSLLTLRGRQLPETILTAIAGSLLCDLVSCDGAPFLPANSRIIEANIEGWPGCRSTKLMLAGRWMPLGRFLRAL